MGVSSDGFDGSSSTLANSSNLRVLCHQVPCRAFCWPRGGVACLYWHRCRLHSLFCIHCDQVSKWRIPQSEGRRNVSAAASVARPCDNAAGKRHVGLSLHGRLLRFLCRWHCLSFCLVGKSTLRRVACRCCATMILNVSSLSCTAANKDHRS